MLEKVQFNGSSVHANQIISWLNGRSGLPPENAIYTRDIVHFSYQDLSIAPGDWIVKNHLGVEVVKQGF